MPAAKRFSNAQITDAITSWQGNAKAAAEALGMSRNCLLQRCARLGLDLDALRRAPAPRTAPPEAMPAFPIKVKRLAPMRVPPAVQDRIRNARYDLCARFRAEISDEAVLAQLVEDTIEPWLAAMLEAKS